MGNNKSSYLAFIFFLLALFILECQKHSQNMLQPIDISEDHPLAPWPIWEYLPVQKYCLVQNNV